MIINKFDFLLSNIKKLLTVFILFTLIGWPAWASNIDVTFSPTPVEKSIGDQWALDILLTGEINASVLSQMNLTFSYDSSVISLNEVDFGDWADSWFSSVPSYSFPSYYAPPYETIELRVDGYLYPPLQMILDNELYATIVFDAVGLGTSLFELVGSGSGGCCTGDDWPCFSAPFDGQITVSGGSTVPEPATMFLLGTGLVGLAGFRRKLSK